MYQICFFKDEQLLNSILQTTYNDVLLPKLEIGYYGFGLRCTGLYNVAEIMLPTHHYSNKIATIICITALTREDILILALAGCIIVDINVTNDFIREHHLQAASRPIRLDISKHDFDSIWDVFSSLV